MQGHTPSDDSMFKRAVDDWLDHTVASELVETMHHPLVILDGSLRVRLANQNFYRAFLLSPSVATGRLLFELGDHEWDIPELRALLDDVLCRNVLEERIETTLNFARAGRRMLVISARRVTRSATVPPELVLLAVEDVTEHRRAMESVRDLEARMQGVIEAATDAIITIDEQGRIDSVNPAVERLFGYTAAELLGQNVNRLMPAPFCDAHDSYLKSYLETGVAKIIGIGREVQGRRKDQTTFPIDLAVSEFRRGDKRGFAGILRDATLRKEMEREIVEIAAREQQRIGQDLHDSTGQELTGLGFLAHDLAERLQDEQHPQAEKAQRLVAGLDRALAQVRRFARGLAPVNVDADGLRAALMQLAGDTRANTGLSCSVAYDPSIAIHDNATASHLFRIAQEAITNAVRYARPQSLRIRLSNEQGAICLRVDDDGTGIADLNKAKASGLGLRIMAYRAELIGGALQIQQSPSGGTCVSCTLIKSPDNEDDAHNTPNAVGRNPAGR